MMFVGRTNPDDRLLIVQKKYMEEGDISKKATAVFFLVGCLLEQYGGKMTPKGPFWST